jgi:hypothetical protein
LDLNSFFVYLPHFPFLPSVPAFLFSSAFLQICAPELFYFEFSAF